MLNQKVADLLNQQINKEFYSAYLYLDFSNYYEAAGLDGFANWYKVQAPVSYTHLDVYKRQDICHPYKWGGICHQGGFYMVRFHRGLSPVSYTHLIPFRDIPAQKRDCGKQASGSSYTILRGLSAYQFSHATSG